MVQYTNRLDNDGRYRVLIDAISSYRNRMGYTGKNWRRRWGSAGGTWGERSAQYGEGDFVGCAV